MSHVMLVSNSFGSLYNFRYELILRLLESYQVTLVTPMEQNEYSLYKTFEEKGCHLITTPFKRRGKNPLQDVKLLENYRRIFQSRQPDFIMTYTIKPNIYAGMAAAKLKIPYFANVTGLGTAFEKEGILKKLSVSLYRRGLKKCRLVFFQNAESCRIMQELKIVRDNYRLVAGSGVNLSKFKKKVYPENDVFLYMARIMKEKGAEEFLQAMQRMKQKYPEVLFDVVGFCEEAYEDRIRKLQEEGVLRYYGWRNDPETFLEACSCLVNPSYHEGLSNVCLEAAASARAVLASDIPGCRETVTDQVSGYLFPAKDADALFDRMERFYLLTREEKIRMGENGRKKMEDEFDRRKVVEIYCEEIKKELRG